MKGKSKKILKAAATYLIFLIAASVTVLPFLWMASTAFKYEQDVFKFPIEWIPKQIWWENFTDVFTKIPYVNYYWNSIKLSVTITVLTLVTSILAGYSFAKLHYKGRDALFLLYLATLMVPWQVIMIPQFITITRIGLADTHLSLILTQSFTPFGVFLIRQSFMGIPDEYTQAAKIDGCGHLKTCFRIITPMAKPGLSALAIFTFMGTWNDYLAPLIFLTADKKRTLQLGLKYFQAEFLTSYALLMAGTLMALAPVIIVYVLAQKNIIEGMASAGGIKG